MHQGIRGVYTRKGSPNSIKSQEGSHQLLPTDVLVSALIHVRLVMQCMIPEVLRGMMLDGWSLQQQAYHLFFYNSRATCTQQLVPHGYFVRREFVCWVGENWAGRQNLRTKRLVAMARLPLKWRDFRFFLCV